jgi:hypothetical protein
MARTRRLHRNFKEGGGIIEDRDRADLDRTKATAKRPSRPGGAPAADRAVRERGETVKPPARKSTTRRRKASVKPPRAADRKLYAHERPPLEPLPERPDQSSSLDSDWRPADVPTEQTPTVVGFSLGAALLSVPISGIRFFMNIGMHAAYAVTRRIRAMLEQPLPD